MPSQRAGHLETQLKLKRGTKWAPGSWQGQLFVNECSHWVL